MRYAYGLRHGRRADKIGFVRWMALALILAVSACGPHRGHKPEKKDSMETQQ